MTEEQVHKGNEILGKIQAKKNDLKVFELACNEGFKPRDFSVNIYNYSSREGKATVSKNVFKTIFEIARLKCESEIAALEKELKEL